MKVGVTVQARVVQARRGQAGTGEARCGSALDLIRIKARLGADCYAGGMSSTALLDSTQAAVASLAGGEASAASIVSRTLLQTPGLRLTLFRFAAGQELSAHTNRRRALVQVLEGRCEFFYNEAWHELAEGELLHLPPNHPHAVRATTEPFTMLLTLGDES